MLPVTAAIPDPTMTPAVWAMASTPPTTPRSRVGTWSGTVAVMAASIALRAAWASAHASTSRQTESAPDSRSIATAPRAAPPRTHGRRRPDRSVVRSENAPHTGFSTVETAAPTPVTRASTASLWSGERASDCCASSTWIGPKKPDHRPMLASTSHSTHSREAGSVGSRSARSTGVAGVAGVGGVGGVAGVLTRRPRGGPGWRRRTSRRTAWACARGCRSRRARARTAG